MKLQMSSEHEVFIMGIWDLGLVLFLHEDELQNFSRFNIFEDNGIDLIAAVGVASCGSIIIERI
mgnify:FL=1